MSNYHEHLKILLPFWAEKVAETLDTEVDWLEYQKEKIKKRFKNVKLGNELDNLFEGTTIEEQSDEVIRLTGYVVIAFLDEVPQDNNEKQENFSCPWRVVPIHQVFLLLEENKDLPETHRLALQYFKIDGQSVCYQEKSNTLIISQKRWIFNNRRMIGYEFKEPYSGRDIKRQDIPYFDVLMTLENGSKDQIVDFFQMIQIVEVDGLCSILPTMLATIKSSKGELYSNNVVCGVLDMGAKIYSLRAFWAKISIEEKKNEIRIFRKNMEKHPQLLQDLLFFIKVAHEKHREKLTFNAYCKIYTMLEMVVNGLSDLPDEIIKNEIKNEIKRFANDVWQHMQSFFAPIPQIKSEPTPAPVLSTSEDKHRISSKTDEEYGGSLSYEGFGVDGTLDECYTEEFDDMITGYHAQEQEEAEREEQLERERYAEIEMQRKAVLEKEQEKARAIQRQMEVSRVIKETNENLARKEARNRSFSVDELNISFLSENLFASLKQFSMNDNKFLDKEDLNIYHRILSASNHNLAHHKDSPVETVAILEQHAKIFYIVSKIYLNNKDDCLKTTEKLYDDFLESHENFRGYYTFYYQGLHLISEIQEKQSLKDSFFMSMEKKNEVYDSDSRVKHTPAMFKERKEINNSFLDDEDCYFLKKIARNQFILKPDDVGIFLNILCDAEKYLSAEKNVVTEESAEMLKTINDVYLASNDALKNNNLIKIPYERMGKEYVSFSEKLREFQTEYHFSQGGIKK